ncbi:MAG: Rap1a/Tai family immunity protein [Methylobacter sp.]
MKAAKLILIALTMAPLSAQAGLNAFIDGHKLYDKSRAYKSGDIDDTELYDAAAYLYYIMGVIDSNIGSGLFCPQSISSDQVANVVTKYLKEHPESLDSSGVALVKSALAKEWPCKQ